MEQNQELTFDPNDPRKRGVLERWYKAVTPLLKHYYGTGGDLNVDADRDVIPITEDCGVWHPHRKESLMATLNHTVGR